MAHRVGVEPPRRSPEENPQTTTPETSPVAAAVSFATAAALGESAGTAVLARARSSSRSIVPVAPGETSDSASQAPSPFDYPWLGEDETLICFNNWNLDPCSNDDDDAAEDSDETPGELEMEDRRPHLDSKDLLEPRFNDDDLTLEALDRFNSVVEVGRGTQGIVYKCTDSSTGQVLAVKELKTAGARKISPELANEIRIMLHLDHPNLTKLYEVFEAPNSDSLYLVIEFVDGAPIMDDKLLVLGKAEALPAERAQSIFQQLVSGLSYLHFRGVLHRDIKPSNVLVSSKGEVKLCDFGVSSFTNKHKSAKVLGEDDIIYVGTCGTPAMLSPEALGGGHDSAFHGRPADVWAAGVTLYCMLYGRLPFTGANATDMITNIIEQALAFPPSPVPNGAREVLTMMLRKDPRKRAVLPAVANHPWVNVGSWKEALSSSQLGVFSNSDASTEYSSMTNPVRMASVLNKVKRRASSVLLCVSDRFLPP